MNYTLNIFCDYINQYLFDRLKLCTSNYFCFTMQYQHIFLGMKRAWKLQWNNFLSISKHQIHQPLPGWNNNERITNNSRSIIIQYYTSSIPYAQCNENKEWCVSCLCILNNVLLIITLMLPLWMILVLIFNYLFYKIWK